MPSPERPVPQPEQPYHPERSEQKPSLTGVTVFAPDTFVPSYFGFIRREGGEPYAKLDKTPEGFTLAVPGEVDFSHLEDELLGDLSFRISGRKERLDTHHRDTRSAISAMIKHEDPQGSDTEDLHLRDPQQYQRYQELLQHPENLQVVRYDVNLPSLSYSVAAENPRFKADKEGCVRTRTVVARTVRWVRQPGPAARE